MTMPRAPIVPSPPGGPRTAWDGAIVTSSPKSLPHGGAPFTTIISKPYDGYSSEAMALVRKRNITIHLSLGDVDEKDEEEAGYPSPTPPPQKREEQVNAEPEEEKPRLKLLDMVLRQKYDKVGGLMLKKTLPVRLEAQTRIAQKAKTGITDHKQIRPCQGKEAATKQENQPIGDKIPTGEASKDVKKQQGGNVAQIKRKPSTRPEVRLPQARKRVGFSCHEKAILEAGISLRTFRSLDVRQSMPSDKRDKTPSKQEQTHQAAVRYLRIQSRLQKTPSVGEDAAQDDYSAPREEDLPTEPFVRYLRYIRAHPETYRQMRSQQVKKQFMNQEYRQRIVALGQALTRVYSRVGEAESIVVQAAYELGCWHQADAWAKDVNNCEGKPKKAPVVNMLDIITKPPQLRVKVSIPTYRGRIAVPSKPDTLKREGTTLDKNSPEYHLRVMRRLRAEVETLIRGLSTIDFIRSREMALRMMEEGDGSIRKWWVSQKFCRYLRKRHRDGTPD